ncbi:MAG: VOC family protein [Planctomycetes bacterium]|nr:VOC family protein [Planctomycetota bacterium]
MTEKGPWPGRFVWHDLMTTDAAKSKEFYCSLFGWTIDERPMPGFTYHMIVAGDGGIGGIVEEKAIPMSHWMHYVATLDIEASAARCRELGGTVCIGPAEIPQTGKFAVVSDPQGGYFSLFEGLPETPGVDPDAPCVGRVCWNELLTTDDGGAQSFYSAMFGWQDAPRDLGPLGTYHVQTLGEAQVAGIMKNPAPGLPTYWVPYFFVAELEALTKRAKDLGATCHVELMPIEGIGRFSMLQDTLGACFALFATP